MCGRFGRKGNKQKIAAAFHVKGGLDEVDFDDDDDARPGTFQPVIKMDENGELAFAMMWWGFKMSKGKPLINARAATIATSNFWKGTLATGRIMIPATKFFEWQGEKGHKTKYDITVPKQPLFAMPGVFRSWKHPHTGKLVDTFAIITSDPNRDMEEIHDRQPVILEPAERPIWLAEDERPPLHVLRTFPDGELRMVPVEGEKKPAQKGLFG
jgi:putative SOS response-associated peptidase YedK